MSETDWYCDGTGGIDTASDIHPAMHTIAVYILYDIKAFIGSNISDACKVFHPLNV